MIAPNANGKAERIAKSSSASTIQTDVLFCQLPNRWFLRARHCEQALHRSRFAIHLPNGEWTRIARLTGNRQSQLLREVKEALIWSCPRTDLRADGQVVLAPFETYAVEVVPAFRLHDGRFVTANTADGGSCSFPTLSLNTTTCVLATSPAMEKQPT